MAKPFTSSLANSSGDALVIPSQLVGGMVAAPFAVCFTDVNGNEYTVTGDTVSSELSAPIPVVLCDSTGRAVVPPLTITSNSNTITVSSTLTGTKLGAPTAIVLCDVNGNPVTLTGVTTGAFVTNPASCVLCDTTGKSLTATYSANVIIAGSLIEWTFAEQAGTSSVNNSSPSTSNNSLNASQRMFQSVGNWSVSSGSITITDNFVAGPNNSNVTASRLVAGGAVAAFSGGTTSGGATMNIGTGNTTLSAWLKLNTGTSATITPKIVGPGTTGTWTVTNVWQRFSLSVNAGSAVLGAQIFMPATTDLLVYGVQLEKTASVSAYVAPTFNLTLGSGGVGGSDLPTWTGNGTITTTNAQRTLSINDTDTTLTTGTFYCAVKSTGTTPQQYGVILECENPTGSGVPSRFDFQSSFWNAPASAPSSAGGSRKFDPYVGFGGTTGLTKEFPSGNLYDKNWHICCITCDGTDVHLYVDGMLLDSPVSSPVAGTPQSIAFNVFGIGITAPSSSLNWPGQVAYVSAYANSVHSYSQIKQNTAAIAAKMVTNGLSNITGVQNGLLVFEGDSITDGIGNAGGVGHPALCGANYGLTWINYAHSGDQVAALTSRAASLDALIDGSENYNILVLLIGRNDLAVVSAGTFEARLQAYGAARQAAGWKVVVCTLLPTTNATAGPLIAGVNTWIRSNYQTFADALADLGGDATIVANVASATYLWDGTHPTALTYTIMTPYIMTAIATLTNKPAQPSNPAPASVSPSPATGTTAGGTTVTVTGTGFLPGAKVYFGPNLAVVTNTTGITNVTPTSITCTTPAHAAGAVDVKVQNLDGQNNIAVGAYTYA